MKRKIVVTLLLLTTCMLPLFTACNSAKSNTQSTVATTGDSSGGDAEYNLDLLYGSQDNSILKQWNGRGDKVTEEFTITTADYNVYAHNVPDVNWQDQKGVLVVTLNNKDTGKSQELANTFRPGGNTVAGLAPGTYYLSIKSANTRWIVRVQKKK